jgi:hypothetical protein
MAGASKQQAARSSTSAQCVECGAWSWRLKLVLVRVLMYCVAMVWCMSYVPVCAGTMYHVGHT